MRKIQSYNIKGMKQDNLVGNGNSMEFAHEIKNMRFVTTGDYTSAMWTVEKSPKHESIYWLNRDNPFTTYGTPSAIVGHAVIDNKLVVFCTNKEMTSQSGTIDVHKRDFIYVFEYKDVAGTKKFTGNLLYVGDRHSTVVSATQVETIVSDSSLDFDEEYPLETLVFYENDKIQKVYFVCGNHQPRVINITGTIYQNNNTQFDFLRAFDLDIDGSVEKLQNAGGAFTGGTIQYVCTYYNKYMQETNIIWSSDSWWPTMGERACGPEEISTDAFKITLTNLDTSHNFEYVRLYSIYTATDGTTPSVKLVGDKPIENNSVTFIDTNTTGESIDYTILYYLGGHEVIAQTMAQKSNTLFLGNIELKEKSASTIPDFGGSVSFVPGSIYRNKYAKKIPIYKSIDSSTDDNGANNSYYTYINTLNDAGSYKVKTFMSNERYWFGVQFMTDKGFWSDVKLINANSHSDSAYYNTYKPVFTSQTTNNKTDGFVEAAIARFQLTSLEVNSIMDDYGFVAARLVVAYPNNLTRRVIAKGVICPTIQNDKEAENHAPDYMSSWFMRPSAPSNTDIHAGRKSRTIDPYNRNIPWAHGDYLSYNRAANGEIQSISHNIKYDTKVVQNNAGDIFHPGVDSDDWYNLKGGDKYVVCGDVVTFNSPDIEFDESLYTLNFYNTDSSYSVFIDSIIPLHSYYSKFYVDADEPKLRLNGWKGRGFIDYAGGEKIDLNQNIKGSINLGAAAWHDADAYADILWTEKLNSDFSAWPIFPFHRNSSLNNYIIDIDGISVFEAFENNGDKIGTTDVRQTCKLKSKVFSTIRESLFNIDSSYNNPIVPYSITLFNQTGNNPVKTDEDFIYSGNVDTYAKQSEGVLDKITRDEREDDGYVYSTEIQRSGMDGPVNTMGTYPVFWNNAEDAILQPSDSIEEYHHSWVGYLGTTADVVPITYKSSPHLVLHIDRGDSIRESALEGELAYPALRLVEIRRNSLAKVNPEELTFVPCGPVEKLVHGQSCELLGLEGDSYIQRYDCLKTMPLRSDDINQIVDITSFMVETRVNLDGRYDNNRGLLDNTIITDKNFNLINKAYTQNHSLFKYHILTDDISKKLDKFSNQITWTKTKKSGEDVDTWTNITMASTADADGVCGEITKLINHKDRLLLFQEHGISMIGYNEKTALSVENGIPLEIANSGKFTGFLYYNNNIGCQNKWSINADGEHVLFIDDSRKELNVFGEPIQSLSDIHGFRSFMINNINDAHESNNKTWKPSGFYGTNNFTTFYDNTTRDVYYLNNKVCIAFNELTNTFTSFYDYENLSAIVNIDDKCIAVSNIAMPVDSELSNIIHLRGGNDYGRLINGRFSNYGMELVCDGSMQNDGSFLNIDKVFDIVELSGDIFNEDLSLPREPLNGDIFDTIAAYNGYQAYKEFSLTNSNDYYYPWKAERKFNNWRYIIPRASYYNDTTHKIETNSDRVRGRFAYVKLYRNGAMKNIEDFGSRPIIHHINISYTVK